jgi:protein-tyrosine phosphatase
VTGILGTRLTNVPKLAGLDISGFRGRQVETRDFDRFDHILAMDRSNYRNLQALRPTNSRAQLSMMLDHLPGYEGRDVADPYYGADDDFESCWRLVDQAARMFAKRLSGESGFS